MTTSLPTEITDEIIDCVHDDRRTLLSCSLIRRSWRTRSQYHLFTVVKLDHRKLHQIEYLSAILTAAPHLAAHIRHIHLPLDLASCDSFISICPLPCIEELKLLEPGSFPRRGVGVHPDNDDGSRLVTAFPNTQSVTITDIEFGHFSVLLELLRAFPRLVRVCLGGTSIELDQELTLQPHSPHDPSLLSLTLDGCWGNLFVPWLDPCVHPLVNGLRCLYVLFNDYVDADHPNGTNMVEPTITGMLAGRLSCTLEELYIATAQVASAKDVIVAYRTNMRPNPALRRARIFIDTHINDPDSDGKLAVLIDHMRDMRLDSHALVSIFIRYNVPHTFEWQAVKQELARAPLHCHFTLTAPELFYDSEAERNALAGDKGTSM